MTNQPSERAMEIAYRIYGNSTRPVRLGAEEIDAAIKEAVADRDTTISILGDKLGERDARIAELDEVLRQVEVWAKTFMDEMNKSAVGQAVRRGSTDARPWISAGALEAAEGFNRYMAETLNGGAGDE